MRLLEKRKHRLASYGRILISTRARSQCAILGVRCVLLYVAFFVVFISPCRRVTTKSITLFRGVGEGGGFLKVVCSPCADSSQSFHWPVVGSLIEGGFREEDNCHSDAMSFSTPVNDCSPSEFLSC